MPRWCACGSGTPVLGGLITQHWQLPERIVRAITHDHDPEYGRDVVCGVVCMANVIAKRVGSGHVAQQEDLDVPRDTLERFQLSLEGVETISLRVQNRLDAMLAQYRPV